MKLWTSGAALVAAVSWTMLAAAGPPPSSSAALPPAAHPTPPRSPGCAPERHDPGAPIRVPHGPADFGVVPEACPATSIALVARLGILVAADDFYGGLLLGGAVRARLELPNRLWVSFWAPGIEHRFLANATVEAASTDLSAGTLGLHVPLALGSRATLAPYARVLLPTESVFQRATRHGVEQGIAASTSLGRIGELAGGWSFPLLLTWTGGAAESLFQPTFAADVILRPWTALALGAGAALRIVPQDPEPFESFDPRLSVRAFPWRGLFIDTSATTPLWGRDRTDVVALLAAGWVAR